MDRVHQLLQYVEEFPPEAGAIELKNQLSSFTHQDLRAACSRLKLSVPTRQQRKSRFISILLSYWKSSKLVPQVAPNRPEAQLQTGIELPDDVVQVVQLFPPHGHVEELENQLGACRAKTLRSACVLLGLQPRKASTKNEFLGLLVNYWQESSVVTSTVSNCEELREEEGAVMHGKRKIIEKEETPKKKKNKTVKRRADRFEETLGVWTASLEKAKIVKEWASAIEVLSHVDGSAESIEAIRKLIDGVVDSAMSDLCEE